MTALGLSGTLGSSSGVCYRVGIPRLITLNMLAIGMRGMPRDALILMQMADGSIIPVTLIRTRLVDVREDGTVALLPGASPMIEMAYGIVLEHDTNGM